MGDMLYSSEDMRRKKLTCLVELYETDLLRTAYIYLQDIDLARDAVQETFLKAYRAIDGFRGECSEKTWLVHINVNTCRDMRRSAWFRHIDHSIDPDVLSVATSPIEEEDEDLLLAVMELPVKLREAILLYYYHDMSVKEIAALLRISSAAVSNRLSRAKTKLRYLLERRGYYE